MLLLPDELKLDLIVAMMVLVLLLLGLDREQGVSLLADLASVRPPEVLLVFGDGTLDEDVIWVLLIGLCQYSPRDISRWRRV